MISKILKILVPVVGVDEMVDLLASEVGEFMNGMERKDDLTLLIARVKE